MRSLAAFLDLTALKGSEDEASIVALCTEAKKANVAAVCVYPQFVSLCRDELAGCPIKVATVANFPKGDSDLAAVCAEVASALLAGADEIDYVFPYRLYQSGETQVALSSVRVIKSLCGAKTLKVILESGAWSDLAALTQASKRVLEAGADFLKTSTGKIETGATPAGAAALLAAIAEFQKEHGVWRGFKASGGIRTAELGKAYFKLAEAVYSEAELSPTLFRIGSSTLLSAGA
ncbi:MAG: deoxyribose-phosphate aldolase [Gammaproteobacteria bacterium]|nr:deoxyribose-phosphate aldolase [Gammaproteobacteria bacterium]